MTLYCYCNVIQGNLVKITWDQIIVGSDYVCGFRSDDDKNQMFIISNDYDYDRLTC